jgi:WD40 repeat protein
VAGTLTVIAMNQNQRAEREARTAEARELAAAAVNNLDVDPERSILLAMEAIRRTRVDGLVLPEAEEALHRAVGASRVVATAPEIGGAVAWSSKGVFVTEGPEGSGLVDIRDAGMPQRSALPPFKGHDGDITDVAFSTDGTLLATTGFNDGKLKVWDPATGDLVWSVPGEGEVWGPSFDADGSLVAAAWPSEGKSVLRVIDVSTGAVVMKRVVPGVSDTSLSPDGSRVAVSSWDGPALAIDVETGRPLVEYIATPTWPTTRIEWSPDGRFVATADSKYGGSVFDARTGERMYALPSVTFTESVAWDPTGAPVLAGGQDGGSVRVWRLGRFGVTEVAALPAQEMLGGVWGVAFSPDGRKVLAGNADITAVKIWDITHNGDEEIARIPATTKYISGVEFTPDGRNVVIHSADSSGVTVWDLETDRPIRSFGPPWPAGGSFPQPTFELSPDGTAIAMMYEGRVTVRDMTTGRRMFVLDPTIYRAMDWSPDGLHLAIGDEEGSATIVDRSGATVSVLPDTDTNRICSVRFSPDGAFLATAACYRDPSSGQSHITLWDLQREEPTDSISNVEASHLAFDPTGTRLAMVTWPPGVEIRDIATGKTLVRLEERAGNPSDVAFSPDGARIATVGVDRAVRVYDVETRRLLLLEGHEFGPLWVEFSPDGSTLASGAHEEVRVWTLDLDELLHIAREELTRRLTSEECEQYVPEACPSAPTT